MSRKLLSLFFPDDIVLYILDFNLPKVHIIHTINLHKELLECREYTICRLCYSLQSRLSNYLLFYMISTHPIQRPLYKICSDCYPFYILRLYKLDIRVV